MSRDGWYPAETSGAETAKDRRPAEWTDGERRENRLLVQRLEAERDQARAERNEMQRTCDDVGRLHAIIAEQRALIDPEEHADLDARAMAAIGGCVSGQEVARLREIEAAARQVHDARDSFTRADWARLRAALGRR